MGPQTCVTDINFIFGRPILKFLYNYSSNASAYTFNALLQFHTDVYTLKITTTLTLGH